MQSRAAKEPRRRKSSESIPSPSRELPPPGKEPVHCQPVSPCDDLRVRIANRAFELHAARGYRQGYALDDWLEAEREILGLESNA